jgi:D-alanyl-D-alanine carboxypeptidase (penicillin-binding protein 5/6)
MAAAGAGPASAGGGPEPAIGGAQLAGHGVIVNGAARRLPAVKTSSFIIADAGTGQVLAAKDPHGWYRPASTLKVLTAVALIPALNPDGTVVATRQATSTEPNVVGLLAGHRYKISDLFTALLTISANDAAIALTQATGSYSRGMALINVEARHLNADDTFAADPNGLDAPGQHTSAYDLALIGRQALLLPAFLKYDRTTTGLFPVSKRKKVGLYNQNSLLTSYPGAVGGKIGWTSAAGATYVGMARRGRTTLIVALLHCPALTEIKFAAKLLDWGFAMDGKVKPVGTLVPPGPLRTAATPRGQQAAVRPGASAQTAGSHPGSGSSALAAAGFSLAALVAAGLGFAYTRRQRHRLRRIGSGRAARPQMTDVDHGRWKRHRNHWRPSYRSGHSNRAAVRILWGKSQLWGNPGGLLSTTSSPKPRSSPIREGGLGGLSV